MSDTAFETEHEHPYTYLWGNLKKTTLDHLPYSVCVVPFERMRKEVAAEHAQEWDLNYKVSREPAETQKKAWVNDEENQQSLLDGFFDVLRPIESLVFFYAKKTPLTDESAAVLLGVARISDIPKGRDWAGSDQGKRQVFWDRVIPHSLRPNFIDGFLMPYTEILERCRAQDIDPAAYTAFVPDATGTDFQYRAGLVSSDSALAALRSLQQALINAIEDIQLKGSWHQVLQWLSERIRECWSDRGPCPGLRAALSAAGVSAASRAALQLHELTNGGDPWPFVEDCLDGKLANPALQRHFRGLLASRLQRMRSGEPARWQVIKLLSRFNITKHQAKAWLEKPDAECAVDDPYQLYLRTRRDREPIPFHAIDRTIYGVKPHEGSAIGFSNDWQDPPSDEPRRIAAIAIECLERGAKEGHTWLPEKAIVRMVSKVVEDEMPLVQEGDLEFLKDILAGQVHKVGMDGWQLDRLHTAEMLIRGEILRRLSNAPDAPAIDARVLVDTIIGKTVQGERDEAARTEKAHAIETIVRAAISTLDGPAGTGKTTAIKALVDIPNIGNVLCLAPTGKARVQIERGFQGAKQRPDIKTVHSFLLGLERWDAQSGHFDVSADGKTSTKYGTIVLDEASMFDVEMLAAVLAACVPCARIVLVGDPRQLPPIGPGRPFVDIVSYIRAEKGPACQLETIMRSKAGEETPFEFARLFDLSRNSKDDELWSWPSQESVGNLYFKYWKDEAELRHLLTEWVRLNLTATDGRAERSFDAWLGAMSWRNTGSHYFQIGCGPRADDWQILSPRRSGAAGTDELNLFIKDQFRREWTTLAAEGMFVEKLERHVPVIPKPVGSLQVTYGDKVICNINQANDDYFPQFPKPLGYVANGEIGIVVGPRRSQAHPKIPLKKLDVEFSSQPRTQYKFWVNDEDTLELAYALTIHRTQGSQFKQTVVVVPDTHFVGPEMLYTALTRSEGPVTVLAERGANSLLDAAQPKRSAVARRLTNIFVPSEWGNDENSWFDRGRIHLATDGTYVRSKSELVISNILHSKRVNYEYEFVLERGGKLKRPDFMIKTDTRTYYWEHLGMLSNSGYAKDWTRKKAWYHANGITANSDKERLIVTKDNADGSLDSKVIERIIDLLE